MKAFRLISTISRKGLLLASGALVALGSIVTAPTSVALAAPAAPPSNAALTRAFQHDQNWSDLQQTSLGETGDIVQQFQNLITEAQSGGIETTAISTALATFQSQISTAESSHTTAAGVISAANGFDSSDGVTDPVAAAQTVHDATQALTDAHVILVQSTRDLLAALRAWEKSNQLLTQIEALQIAYADEQAWLGAQQHNLTKADTAVTNVQNLISVAQSNGLNPAGLSTALTLFQSQLAAAQTSDGAAANLLSVHAGFDNSGNVTSAPAALLTVNESRQSLLAAHNVLVQSSNNLMRALTLWRAQNHVSSSSPAYSAYAQAYGSVKDLHDSVSVENGAHLYGLDIRLANLLRALLKEA
ncbi:MAG TPA: hypothetical protein VLZ89_11285 [Anaerolineales bacterium]|nr:hypothetical protein [Anaerolineales bacterium]